MTLAQMLLKAISESTPKDKEVLDKNISQEDATKKLLQFARAHYPGTASSLVVKGDTKQQWVVKKDRPNDRVFAILDLDTMEMQVLDEANTGYSALAQSFKSKYFPRNSPNLTSFKDIESHIENSSDDPYQKFGAESLIELVIAELVLTHGAKVNFSKDDIVNYPLSKSIQTKFDNKTLTKILQ